MEKNKGRKGISVLLIEVLLYAVFMSLYIYLGLRYMGEPMYRLFNNNLSLYSVAVILLILVQAVLLEFIVNFLIKSLGIFKTKE